MKKLISIILSLTLVSSILVGCQGSKSTSSDTSSTKSGKVKISFIDGFTGGDGAYMKKIIDNFNASQDKYEIDELTTADEYVKFKSDNFDMLVIHSDWISTYHADGLLRDMTDIYKAAGISIDDFHPITKTFAQYDDGIFAVPFGLYADTMFYNKKLVSTPPKTYADLIALRDKLKSETSGIYPLAIPLTGDHQWLWTMMLWQNNIDLVEGQHIKLDTDEVANTFMDLNKMIYTDKLSPANLGANDHLNAFMKNVEGKNNIQAAIAIMGPWNYTAAKEKWGNDLGIAAVPALGKNLVVPAGGHNFAVSSKVKDQAKLDGIAAFMKYVCTPEVLSIWADAGQTPVHLKTIEYIKQNPDKYPVSIATFSVLDKCKILPAVYNIREQLKYVNDKVYPMVITTPNLSKEKLMTELKTATTTATELSEK